MKTPYKVARISFKTIHELPNAWTDQNYKDLLELMDYGDPSELTVSELKEMCLMSLTDYQPEEAAKIVLEYVFKDRLNKGQIQNLSNEMLEEKMWEEYADLSLHEEFFKVNQLLYEAYNGKFPHPEAVLFQVKVTATEKNGLSVFGRFPEAPLIRLLVAGMPTNTLLFRLFEEQLDGEAFKDAKDIIWQLKSETGSDDEILFTVISSAYWFHDFKYVDVFDAETHADTI
tara:strand:- start:1838 stop:2524 length:687 start_codon:yes stop_codon:yes gene_type:complete